MNPPLLFAGLLTGWLCTASAFAGSRALVDTTRSPHTKMHMPDLADVRWNESLLGERFEVYCAWGNRDDTEMSVWLPAR